MTVPGLVNAHTHIYSGLAPLGMPAPVPEPRDFREVLERVWWRLDRALDARSLRAAARLYVAEALLHGTTTLVDHHESPNLIEGSLDVLADACQELGMRALLCYGATERNGGRDEAERGLAECARFIESNQRPHVRGLIGLHASFTVSSATLEQAAELAADLEVPIHVHVAEDLVDVADAHRRGASGPLARMFAAGALPPGSILAHGVHLERAQVRDAEHNRLWIVQNPRSNEGNRVGYPAALAASARVALGTDGYPSDLRAELQALFRLAAVHEPATPRSRLEARLTAGRELAAEQFGEIEMASDVVEFAAAPLEAPAMVPRRSHEPHPSPAEAMAPAEFAVARVAVAGRTVARDGRLLTADLEEIRAEAAREGVRLWRRMEAL